MSPLSSHDNAMTPDAPLPATMTDEQLIEAVATEVMKWNRGPHPDGITARAEWWYLDGKALRPAYKTHRVGQWNPVTGPWDDTMEVVNETRDQGFEFNLKYFATALECAASFVSIRNKRFEVVANDPQRAICEAALLTIRSS